MTTNPKVNFVPLRFLHDLCALRVSVLEGDLVGEIIDNANELIETGAPFLELRDRAKNAYLGNKANSPELMTKSKQPDHKAYFRLTETLEDLELSWNLCALRIERFSSAFEHMKDADSSFDPKAIMELEKEIERFTSDFIGKLSDYERIFSTDDLATVNNLREHFFKTDFGPNFE